MDNWQVARGSTARFTITIRDGAGQPVAYAGTEALSGSVWAGDDLAPAFALATTWNTPGAGTADVPIPGSSTAAIDVGTYHVRVQVDGVDAFYSTLDVSYSPGTAVELPTYCTYQDMLGEAGWVAQVQDLDTDQAGFAAQRARARQDLDDAIAANYRGSSAGLFGAQSLAAMNWGGGGPRTTRPSQTILDYLRAGALMRGRDPARSDYRPKVATMATYRAISLVGLRQIGINQQHAAMGAMFYRMYLSELSTFTAELDINGDGLCEISIPCVATNTLFT